MSHPFLGRFSTFNRQEFVLTCFIESFTGSLNETQVITNNIELHKLFEAAKNKKINVEEYATSQMTVSFELAAIVQDVVWEITEKTEGFRVCKVNCVKE